MMRFILCAGAGWRRWVLLFAVCGAGAAVAAPSISVPLPPAPLPMAAGQVLVYELNVRNPASAACARLIDVHAQGGEAESRLERRYRGSLIAANMFVYSAAMEQIDNSSAQIPPGGGAAVFFYLTLANGKPAPESLRHDLTFTACAPPVASGATETVVFEMPVADTAPVVIGLPFRGEGWVAADSVNPGGTHRRALIPLYNNANPPQPLVGQFHFPERYAIDWVKVDDQARRASGPMDSNTSYFAYHQEIVAVADGVISRTRDGFADETPPSNPPIADVATAAGNYIMQDIGGGHFALYAHLSPGTLRVAEGEHVSRGQVIALLGNTGNSSEPHLHFHVSNANDPLVSEGLPFVFDHFQTTGHAEVMNDMTGLFDDYVRYDAVPLRALMPQSYSVVTTEATRPVPRMRADRRGSD